jgi:hypothetical protein
VAVKDAVDKQPNQAKIIDWQLKSDHNSRAFAVRLPRMTDNDRNVKISETKKHFEFHDRQASSRLRKKQKYGERRDKSGRRRRRALVKGEGATKKATFQWWMLITDRRKWRKEVVR